MAVNFGRCNIWAPYKDLANVVDAALFHKDPDMIPDLEAVLKKHRTDFLSLLQNPGCSAHHRQAVKAASTEGIAVVGQASPKILPQSLVDEALIISDMFELNELASLELLITAQNQQSYFPGLSRGVVAVLLYYDGRRSLVNALRSLVQARDGRMWTLGLNTELATMITTYTDQLQEDGLVMKVLDKIEGMNLAKELDLLQKNRALGGPRYRKQVVDMIKEIHHSLAEIVFCWACQSALTDKETERLLNHIIKHGALQSDGVLDNPTFTLLMALLYTINVSILQSCEETDVLVSKLPLVVSPSIANVIHKEVITSDHNWSVPGLKPIIKFSWAITLRTLSQYPLPALIGEYGDVLEDDEKIVDESIKENALNFYYKLVASSPLIHQEEFYIKCLHNIITDFIVLMPLKIKDLQNHGDETARIIAAHRNEGLEPPADLPLHYEHMLYLIAELYKKDPLNLNLALEYWCPTEVLTEHSYIQRPTQRQMSLKFIHRSGDLLPPSLFVPYITMLTSLSNSPSCAHYCFNLLKMNSRGKGGQYAMISWDHFFASLHQYYTNLRQEMPPQANMQYLYRTHPISRGITPQEIEGLIAVLGLIEVVAKNDEVARLAFYENPQYIPFVIFLGLVSCSVPPELKSALLKTLAAFAQSTELASSLWLNLEMSQLLPPSKTTMTYQRAGLEMELEEVEARNEEYPITRAFLSLLDALTDHPLPTTIGSGQRSLLFNPYLSYIRDTVFLQFNNRLYKNVVEKWEIVTLCVKLLEKLLRHYEVSSADFAPYVPQTSSSTGTSPGFFILAHLLTDSKLLKTVLFVLDECSNQFDQYVSVPGKEFMEQSTLLCLKLLQQALIRQEEFLFHVRNTGCELLVTGLDRLMFSINPRSGQADYLVVNAKYVTYNAFLLEHALVSLSLLTTLCQKCKVAQDIVNLFTADSGISSMLLHGFVECLESEEPETSPGKAKDEDLGASCAARQQVLQLLLTCLEHPIPTLAHFLLGFQLSRPISQTTFQEPGILGSPRTCLHEVLAIVDRDIELQHQPSCVTQMPKTCELAYQLLYKLCANRDTCGPVVRYLRSTYDFFYRHLQCLPFRTKQDSLKPQILLQQSWLLKMIAVELRLTSLHCLSSHVERLLRLLLCGSPHHRLPEKKLLVILDSLEFTHNYTDPPRWDYFEPGELQKVISECEIKAVRKPVLVDVTKLHKRLREEISSAQGIASLGQGPMIMQELRSILQYILKCNKDSEAIFAKRQAFEAWQQVMEIVLTSCPLEIFSKEQRLLILLETSQKLIQKVMDEEALTEITALVSGATLMLMSALNQLVMPRPFSGTTSGDNGTQEEGTTSYIATYSSTFLVILKGILESLLRTGSGLQRVRTHYYTSLLNLLYIQKQKAVKNPQDEEEDVEDNVDADRDKLGQEYMEAILAYGKRLMEVVCRDACSGHDVTRMVALATLDAIISMDGQQLWLDFLSSKGYLQHLIDSLLKDDKELYQILTKGSENLRSLYLFESKLAVLVQIAGTVHGAQILLQIGVMQKLSLCTSIDMRPDQELRQDMESEIVPHMNLMQCYEQVFFPVLKLVFSLATSLGPTHREVSRQLLGFVVAHMNVFGSILHEGLFSATPRTITQLAMVTSVLSCTELGNPEAHSIDPAILAHHAQLEILQQQLLNILPSFVALTSSSHQHSFMQPATVSSRENAQLQQTLSQLEVIANILTSCCSIMKSGTAYGQTYRVFFIPSLTDALSHNGYFYAQSEARRITTPSTYPPGLGLIVKLILESCQELQDVTDRFTTLSQQLQTLPTSSLEELNELYPRDKYESFSAGRARELAHKHVQTLLQHLAKESSLLIYIIEMALLVLWHHLEYYLLYYRPSDSNLLNLTPKVQKKTPLRNLQEFKTSPEEGKERSTSSAKSYNVPHVTVNELNSFKTDVKTVLGDTFFHKIQSVEPCVLKMKPRVGFMRSVVRRLKRLAKFHTD